jgi:CubicO group peptidase (beta-lactamase class C family)
MAEESTKRPLPDAASRRLEAAVGRDAPAVTYAFLHRDGAVSSFARGRADAASDAPIDPSEPVPLYSMTKAITAIAVLELLARRSIGLDADVRDLVPSFPFREHRVRVGDLLAHTSGLPNPFPLRWVHRPAEHASFDDGDARDRICETLRAGPPNVGYRYSNIGYWWLGAVIEALSGKRYGDALVELGLPSCTDYPPSPRALGHVRRFGILRAVALVALDPWVLAGSSGRWMRIARHHVDGLAYGGLLGTAEGLVPFLRRILGIGRGESGNVLRRALLYPWRVASGRAIPMTAALHVGDGFLFKEGGGAGFHSELRVHVDRGSASVVIANSSEIDVKRLLRDVDGLILAQRAT